MDKVRLNALSIMRSFHTYKLINNKLDVIAMIDWFYILINSKIFSIDDSC